MYQNKITRVGWIKCSMCKYAHKTWHEWQNEFIISVTGGGIRSYSNSHILQEQNIGLWSRRGGSMGKSTWHKPNLSSISRTHKLGEKQAPKSCPLIWTSTHTINNKSYFRHLPPKKYNTHSHKVMNTVFTVGLSQNKTKSNQITIRL